MIPLTRPELGAEEQAAVAEVLSSGMLVQGAGVLRFEAALAVYTGRRHAIAVSNGTTALELALRALGVRAGDRVLCPDLTWPSPAHAILACGAEPLLVDVDAAEWNAGPAQFLTARAAQPVAAIVIDQFGNPARITEIADALPGVALIADAACSLGSRLSDAACGALGTIACTSFHPRKVITTGEGGMCLTDDDALAQQLRELRNHGQSTPGVFGRAAGNYRLTELAAALGSAQVTRLPAIVAARTALAERYRDALRKLPLTLQGRAPLAASNHQTFGVLLPSGTTTLARDAVIEALAARGVQAGRLSYALHRLPHLVECAKAAEAAGRSLSNSAAIATRGLALPLYPGLSEPDQDQVIAALFSLLG